MTAHRRDLAGLPRHRPAGVLLDFLRCWIQLHALVALEVSSYPGIASVSESGTMHADTAGITPGLAGW